MKYRLLKSGDNYKIEILSGDDTIVIKGTEDGTLSIKHQSMSNDMKIIPLTSNEFELEFVGRGILCNHRNCCHNKKNRCKIGELKKCREVPKNWRM